MAVPAALVLAIGAFSGAACATPLGTNLLLNGDAEAEPGSASGNDVELIPDWTTTSNFTVVQYGAPAFPTPDVATAIGAAQISSLAARAQLFPPHRRHWM